MTERIAYLEAVVGADITSFRKGMQEVRRETGILSDTVQGLGHVGRNMTLAITAPLAAMAYGTIQAAGSFDAAMRNINSIAFLAEDKFKSLSQRTLEFGATIRSGPQAAAEALYTVFSAGITDVDTAFNVMKVGAQTAEAGLADLTATTEGLVAAALTFGDQSPKAIQKYSDAITLAVQLGVGSMDSFNTGFANSMGTAAAVGQSFEEMASVIAFLSQRGIQAGAAGTYLNNALTKLIKPTEDMTALWDKMGVKSGSELLKTFGGFIPALRAIYKEIGANEQAWAKLFNDVRGFKAVSRIFTAFETDGTDAVSEFFGEFDEKLAAGGLTMAAWEQQMMSFEAQWGMLTSAVQGFAITVGNLLLPILLPIVQAVTDFILQAQQADPVLLKLGVTFAGLVAAAGPVLWLLGSLISPVGLLIGLVGTLAIAFATNWGGIQDSTLTAINNILGPLDELKRGIEIFFSTLFDDTPEQGASPLPETLAARKKFVPIEFELLPSYSPEFKGIADLAKQHGVGIDDILKALGVGSLQEAMSVTPGKYTMMIEVDPQFTFGKTGDTDFLNNPNNPMGMGFEGVLAGAESGDNSIGAKLARAFDAAWPVIQPAISRMWENVKNWFTTTAIPELDRIGGNALNSIAGWFSGTNGDGGNTPIYTSLRNLLNADIGKAASDIGTVVDENFPNAKAGLNNFITQFGNWFTEEAVPTVSRSIGYFAGTLVSLIAQAIPMAFSALTGGGGDAAGAVAGFISDSITTPMQEGINQAVSDRGIGGGDAIVTGLATNLVLLLAGNALLTKLIGLDIGGKVLGLAVKAIGMANIGQVLSGLSLSGFVAGLGATIGSALETLAIRGLYFMDAATLLGGKVLSAVAGVISSPITLGLTLGTLLYIAIPQEWKDALHNAFSNLIDMAFGEGATDTLLKNVERAGYQAVGLLASITGNEALQHAANVNLGIDDSPEAKERARQAALGFSDFFYQSLASSLMDSDFGVDLGSAPWVDELWNRAVEELTANPQNQVDMSGFVSSLLASSNISALPATEQEMFRQALTESLNMVLEGIELTPEVNIAAPVANTTGWADAMNAALAEGVGGTPGAVKPSTPMMVNVDDMLVFTPESVQRTVDDMSSLVGGAVAGAVAAGNFDGQPIADSLVLPIETAFLRAFGIEGTVSMAWGAFLTKFMTDADGFISKMALIGTEAEKLRKAAVDAFTGMASAINPLLSEIHSAVFGVSSAINVLVGAFLGLQSLTGGNAVSGSVPGRASGGSAEGWTMVGERGPELVHFGQRGMVFPSRMLRDAGGGGGTTVNNMEIYGVQDVDGLLYELERRGINLTAR